MVKEIKTANNSKAVFFGKRCILFSIKPPLCSLELEIKKGKEPTFLGYYECLMVYIFR